MITAVSLPTAIHYYPAAIRHLFPPEPGIAVPENTNYAISPLIQGERMEVAAEEPRILRTLDEVRATDGRVVLTPPYE